MDHAALHAAGAALLVAGDVGATTTRFATDYLVHLADGRTLRGHDALRAAVTRTRRAFSDLTVEVEVWVQAHDRVAWQRTLRGTPSGACHVFPASGREIVWWEQVVRRVVEGAAGAPASTPVARVSARPGPARPAPERRSTRTSTGLRRRVRASCDPSRYQGGTSQDASSCQDPS